MSETPSEDESFEERYESTSKNSCSSLILFEQLLSVGHTAVPGRSTSKMPQRYIKRIKINNVQSLKSS